MGEIESRKIISDICMASGWQNWKNASCFPTKKYAGAEKEFQ